MPEQNKLRNPAQALAMALVLGVTAPDSSRAADCIRHAESIASGMDPRMVDAIRDAVEICLNTLPLESCPR